jgi:acyl-CoA thioesterase FadM
VLRGAAGLFDDDELGAHVNLLHASQEYEFHRPVRLGDVLECSPWISNITSRRGNDFLTLQIDCAVARTGERVVTSIGRLVFLETGE